MLQEFVQGQDKHYLCRCGNLEQTEKIRSKKGVVHYVQELGRYKLTMRRS